MEAGIMKNSIYTYRSHLIEIEDGAIHCVNNERQLGEKINNSCGGSKIVSFNYIGKSNGYYQWIVLCEYYCEIESKA